ncbi:MAG: GntR family transcriptional regulator [Planctomycetes bacterium]|nr:GntR family transcriptional regulator [Planctomycetota bacterium]MBL7142939.1 GntR family transcriptional regulator [Phycisphaerae bacterium]
MIEFKLDLKSGVPFHRQIVDQIRYGIASDRLMPGEQLPTVRELAVHLQINPNTVRKAYSELEILGILDTQQGTGTFVSHRQVEIGQDEKQRMLGQICDELVARGNQYGFTVKEIVTHMQRRLENG